MSAATAQSVPKLRRGVRLQFDTTRGQNVLQCPERIVLLDDIANAIIELCDGSRSIAEISCALAARYEEDVALVEEDVRGFVGELLEKGLVTL
jgi:pyrroloquinoline quinone biosynthesis protein D